MIPLCLCCLIDFPPLLFKTYKLLGENVVWYWVKDYQYGNDIQLYLFATSQTSELIEVLTQSWRYSS